MPEQYAEQQEPWNQQQQQSIMPISSSPNLVQGAAKYTSQEEQALTRQGPATAAVSSEMNALRTMGAKAAFHQAESDAKNNLSIAAAKRAEALAKVIAMEKANRQKERAHAQQQVAVRQSAKQAVVRVKKEASRNYEKLKATAAKAAATAAKEAALAAK